MDKYEFNLKVEQLNKLVKSGDYKAAMRITDTIDWSRVHNAGLLTTVSEVYEKNGEYREAREVLLLAYDRAPVGKRALYRLTMLALKEGDISEAQAYYKEYTEISPQDSRKYLMEYHIAVAKGYDINKKIRILEKYCDIEKTDEQWKYELAVLYVKAGRIDDCIKTCDEIMLLFGVGEYVEKAAALKESTGCPLSSKQQEQVDNKEYYEVRLSSIVRKYESGDYPNLNLDDMSVYNPIEDRKATINLIDDEEVVNEDTHINTELFPKVMGVNEVRISETTFKGESVNPEFEAELKRAIAITNENLSKMKGEDYRSSMAEIDEEVRARMERVERIKQGRFTSPLVMAERKKYRINNHFDSMGLPKTHGNREEYQEMMAKMQNTCISEEQEVVSALDEEKDYELLAESIIQQEECLPEVSDVEDIQGERIEPLETEVDIDTETKDMKIDLIDINQDIVDSVSEDRTENVDTISKDGDEVEDAISEENTEVEDTISEENTEVVDTISDEGTEVIDDINEDSDVEEIPVKNITVTETASTKVLENYVPEKKVPIFDNDDLINSYYDEEVDTGVPTVSSVMAKRKEQKNIVKSSIKSETKMEVVDNEEIYYTKEERTFVTKVKRGEEPEEIILEPIIKEIESDDEEVNTIVVEEDITASKIDKKERKSSEATEFVAKDELKSDIEDGNNSDENETIVIEENADDEIREVDLSVQGKVMKARAPKSREPKEFLMRRPGSIMVEGITAEQALENAKNVLREVNERTKIKHSVLKIGADSLNNRGVMNSIDKIKGKDLIIVEAGKLDDNTIAELIEFIRNGKETVIFTDTISGIERLIESNDLLHGMSLVMREDEVPVKRKNIVANIVLKERDDERAIREAEEKKELERKEAQKKKEEAQAANDLMAMDIIANILRQETGDENIQFEIQEIGSSNSIKFYKSDEDEKLEPKEEKQTIKLDPVISNAIIEESSKLEKPKKEVKTVERESQKQERKNEKQSVILEKEAKRQTEEPEKENRKHPEVEEVIDYNSDDNTPMGVDQFIAYALNYVKEIECVLSYKTEYAIEERADYMKEDGTPLTKKNARNLVDHAADLAEKPGIMKSIINGLTNSKYDKEGRLILREEHFRI